LDYINRLIFNYLPKFFDVKTEEFISYSDGEIIMRLLDRIALESVSVI
jgi:hypothetical protein